MQLNIFHSSRIVRGEVNTGAKSIERKIVQVNQPIKNAVVMGREVNEHQSREKIEMKRSPAVEMGSHLFQDNSSIHI